MLTYKADKCVKELKEMKDFCAKMIGNETTLMSMGSDELSMMQSSLRLIDASAELMMEQAEIIENMNRKLDRLLEAKERA